VVLPIKELLGLMAENTKKAGIPIPVKANVIYGWAEPLNIPRGGEVVLYTGCLYQLVPYINATVKYLEKLEGGIAARLALKVTRVISKVIDLTSIVTRVPKEEIEKQYEILRAIAKLLHKAGIKHGYLYENDMYSGVLLYDMGFEEEFTEHSKKVYEAIKKSGAKKVITIDPHSLHILRSVYPDFIDGYDLEVTSYLEELVGRDLKPVGEVKENIVIHDSCVYARYEDIVEQPRELLRTGNVEFKEPKRSGKLTYCCGGPIEFIIPKLSRRIASARVEELIKYSNNITVSCPICYANFVRAAPENVKIEDLAIVLLRAYGVG